MKIAYYHKECRGDFVWFAKFLPLNGRKPLKQLNNYQASANLLKLKSIASQMLSGEYLQPLDFLEYLKIMIKTQPEEDDAEIDKNRKLYGAVTVMTIHKAKGMSLPIVIMPNIDRNLINRERLPKLVIDESKRSFSVSDFTNSVFSNPMYEKILEQHLMSELAEEIRVFYVAVTRAENILILGNTRSKGKLVKRIEGRGISLDQNGS